ncbi:hypothetical protein X975_15371, partial [Stegodyphus mimosarum]
DQKHGFPSIQTNCQTAGAGITLTNLPAIAESTKAKEFHSSARLLVPSSHSPEAAVVEGTGHKSVTSSNVVRDMVTILKQMDAIDTANLLLPYITGVKQKAEKVT